MLMYTFASIFAFIVLVNSVIGDGLTRDIQQTEAKIAAELAEIQEDVAEEAILRSIIGGRPGGDALTRDIQRQEAQIASDLARIQVDATEERIVQQAVRGGGGGFNGNGFNNGGFNGGGFNGGGFNGGGFNGGGFNGGGGPYYRGGAGQPQQQWGRR